MIDHLGLQCADLAASGAFYDAVSEIGGIADGFRQ